MRIKSLQITGFKSFVDRTVFRFEPGITSIVGPNGCGKSNVVDAVRWAMGEQSPRRLRGRSMEDVVFAGSEARAPVGMAEVVITFANDRGVAPPQYAAYGEIEITRRLYRTGESEYRINRTPCRLRDVLDFFRDTGIGVKGYTIVEQGRIAGIVSAKPEERRALIEEAAGIGKYKARRSEAERKLASTEQNLLRVSDVLGEIRRQIGSIERQARKAARYKRLREEVRALDLSLAQDERRDRLAAIEESRHAVRVRREELTAGEARLAEREAALEEKRVSLAECERVVSQGSEALHALRAEIKQLESRIDFQSRERESLREANEQRAAERVELHGQRESLEADARQAEEELAALETTLGAEEESIAAAEAELASAREALRGLGTEREAANAALVDALTGVARCEDRIAALEDRRDELERRLRSADAALELQQTQAVELERKRDDLEQGLQNLLAERDRLRNALREALEAEAAAAAGAQAAAERLREVRDARESRGARLESLREVLGRHEDVSEGTRYLLEQIEQGGTAREAYGLRALVRDVLEVDPEAEPAVEAVLGRRAEALVVERPEGAVAALRALRDGSAGRGSFFFPPKSETPLTGFVPLGRPLLDHVRARPGFEPVAESLLGGANLVPDLDEAARLYGGGRLPCTFVTPDGDVLEASGTIAGGGRRPTTGALARVREVRELEDVVERLDAELAGARAAHDEAEQARQGSRDTVENLRNRTHTAELAVANHEKDLERTRERHKALGEAREGRVAERSSMLAESEAIGSDLGRLQRALQEAREARVERQRSLETLEGRLAAAGREVSRLEAGAAERRAARDARIEKRDRLREALERARAAARETQDWIERREREIAAAESRRAALAEALRADEEALAQRLRDEEDARVRYDERRDAYERELAESRSIESALRDVRAELGSYREAVQQAELRLREAELGLEHLEGSIRERWEVDLATWAPEAPLPEADDEPDDAADDAAEAERALDLVSLPREDRQRLLRETRRKLEALGEVNLGALEEHEELRERMRFLTEQRTDLETTITSLREAIQRINRTSRRRFRETFEAVNDRFQKVFPRLFRGGKASLMLTEGEDVLEAGIEIVAMPPGKRLQNVNLLSGGEKTLTAISLLVAVFQVKTSPFFLLDEVDAALDDANVGRFNEVVREMAEDSQFLLITHNKRTIEVSDILYGVTMEEKGVSKLVSVELH